MKSIRVTSLGSFYACAYKYKYDTYDIQVKDTYKGDIINAAAESDNSVKPFIDYYIKHINTDLKLGVILEECAVAASKYIKYKKEDNPDLFAQERKFVYKYDDEYIIEGTPDIYYQSPDGKFHVEDLKMSTHSWFEDEESWTYNMQTYIYPLMVMEYYGVDECSFAYYVFDKGNAKGKLIGPRVRTKEECETKLKEVMDAFLEAEFTEQYKPNKNRYCWFCKLKDTCPLRAKKQATIVETL